MSPESPKHQQSIAQLRQRLSQGRSTVSEGAFGVLKVLQDAGHEAWLAGGCVRDLLLGQRPTDFDIATNALPQQVMTLFPRTVPTGLAHGTVTVLWTGAHPRSIQGGQRDRKDQGAQKGHGDQKDQPDREEQGDQRKQGERGEHDNLGKQHGGQAEPDPDASPAPASAPEAIEVTTFRGEGEYRDGRRPESVSFLDSVEQDLSRRDFTVNAMAYDPVRDELRDPFDGLVDLSTRCLRAVGHAQSRFREDGLRPLRAVRFASVLGFRLQKETSAAIPETLSTFRQVAAERVRDEFDKILLRSPRPSRGMELLAQTGLLQHILPKLHTLWLRSLDLSALDVDGLAENGLAEDALEPDALDAPALDSKPPSLALQLTTPSSESWTQLLTALDYSPPKRTVRLAILLLFQGASESLQHNARQVQSQLQKTLEALRYPRSTIKESAGLVLAQLEELSPANSDAELRRQLSRITADLLNDTLAIREALIKACLPSAQAKQELSALKQVQHRLNDALERAVPLQLSALALTGDELKAQLRLPPGPELGALLRVLLAHVLEIPADNNKERLLALAQEWRAGSSGDRG